MEPNTKRRLAAGAAAAVAVAGGGVAIGATQFHSNEESAAVVAVAAKQLGIEPSKLSAALEKALAARVDAAVAAAAMTKEQGDAMKAKIKSGELPLFLPMARPRGFGRGLGRAFGFGLRPGLGPFQAKLDTAADYLGLTQAELRTELASGKTLAEVATAYGKTADGLVQALYDAQKKELDAAVTARKLTKSQEESVLADLKSRITDLVNGKILPHRGHGFGHFKHFAANLDDAAAYLGVTAAQLRTEVKSGKTLAQIATAQGKTAAGLIQAMYEAQKKDLDAAVASGKLTRKQADALLANLKERIADLVNGDLPRFDRDHVPGPPGLGGFRGFRGGPPPERSGFPA